MIEAGAGTMASFTAAREFHPGATTVNGQRDSTGTVDVLQGPLASDGLRQTDVGESQLPRHGYAPE